MSFKINRVYTRSGDKGETSLVDGSRVSKNNSRCEIFGTLDELNACLGVCKEYAREDLPELVSVLEYIQQELFDLGSEVATPSEYTYPGMWSVQTYHIEHLEKLCDHYNKELPELDSFILPGGSKLCSHLHVARTIARRAERCVVSLLQEKLDALSNEVLQYCNRVSDLFFVLSRYVLYKANTEAPLWKQEKERISPLEGKDKS